MPQTDDQLLASIDNAYRELDRTNRAQRLAGAVLSFTIPATIVGVLFIAYLWALR